MKKILLILTLFLGVYASFLSWAFYTPSESTEDQTIRLNQELWKLQNQFQLEHSEVVVHAVREKDMLNEGKPCKCWGWTNVETNDIAIMDIRDMPMSIPWKERAPFQNLILQHEVLHIVFTQLGMPGPVQDRFIEALQPFMIKP
jgi:hypothetical protein